MIDIVLAGDNAIVVGALAAGLPADQRKKVILIGIGAALVLRIVFALVVTLADGDRRADLRGRAAAAVGGWKILARDPRTDAQRGREEIAGDERSGLKPAQELRRRRLGGRGRRRVDEPRQRARGRRRGARASRHPDHRAAAVGRADGPRGEHHRASIIERYRWIAYVGLLVIILIVAGKMIYEGWVGADETLGLACLC